MSLSSNDKKRKLYQCLRCFHKTGKTYVEARYRVMAHFLKQHVGLDEVPYHCSLCLFRSFKREDLDAHVRTYPRHQLLLKEKGVKDDAKMLVSCQQPYVIGDRDVAPLTDEEARRHWEKKRAQKPDLLAEAVKETFPGGLPVPQSPASGADIPKSPLAANVQAMAPNCPSQPGEPAQSTPLPPAAGLQQLQQLLLAVLQPVLPVESAKAATPAAPKKDVEKEDVMGVLQPTKETKEEDVTGVLQPNLEVVEENIMGDLLPTRASSPGFSSTSESGDDSSTSSEVTSAAAMERTKHMEKLEKAISANTRALGAQEAMLKELVTCVMGMSKAILGTVKTTDNRSTQTESEALKRSRPKRSPYRRPRSRDHHWRRR